MDFVRAYEALSTYLEGEGFRFAVVGGLALHAFGLTRATGDLDIVTETRAQAGLVVFLEGLGFETLHRSPGYSNHSHPIGALGRIDCIYISGNTSEQLFQQTERKEILPGFAAPVPRPEHLAAMKVFALTRKHRELADLAFLVRLPGVDRNEIRAYFTRFDMETYLDELEG